MQFITDHWGVIATMLLGVSELISFIPGIQANSIAQAIINGLRAVLAPKA